MSGSQKKLRYWWWLISAFAKKNGRFIVISFVGGFFLIFLLINLYPTASNFLFGRNNTVGLVGDYPLDNPPTEISTLISNPLISINDKGEVVPVLINSWEILNSQKVYRFHLKNNLLWSDGKPFSAFDLTFSFKGIKVNATDPTSIEFTLNQPLSIFPIYLTKPVLKKPLKGIGGAYKVQSYKVERGKIKQVHLIPLKKGLKPISFRFYQTEDQLTTAYKKGEISKFITNRKSIADEFTTWKNTEVSKTTDFNQIITLFFNMQSKLLSGREIRRAIVQATPLNSEFGQKAQGPIPPTSWAHATDLRRYNFEPEKAKEAIGKLFSASDSAKLSLYTFYDYISLGETIKKSYESAGLGVDLKVLSYIPQDFDMLLTAWNPPQDPDQYFFWHSTQSENNITNYKNVKVDKYLEDGRKTIKTEERKKIYADFQKTLVDDLPAYFMYYPTAYTIERK